MKVLLVQENSHILMQSRQLCSLDFLEPATAVLTAGLEEIEPFGKPEVIIKELLPTTLNLLQVVCHHHELILNAFDYAVLSLRLLLPLPGCLRSFHLFLK
jgi:hypothetical protein